MHWHKRQSDIQMSNVCLWLRIGQFRENLLQTAIKRSLMAKPPPWEWKHFFFNQFPSQFGNNPGKDLITNTMLWSEGARAHTPCRPIFSRRKLEGLSYTLKLPIVFYMNSVSNIWERLGLWILWNYWVWQNLVARLKLGAKMARNATK